MQLPFPKEPMGAEGVLAAVASTGMVNQNHREQPGDNSTTKQAQHMEKKHTESLFSAPGSLTRCSGRSLTAPKHLVSELCPNKTFTQPV